MRVLALDQASHISGYSIFEDKQLIKSGLIPLKDDHFGQRLYALRQLVKQMVEENGIDIILLENVQYQNNAETLKILGEVLGVLEELAVELVGINYKIISCNTWRSGLGIKGTTRAEQKRNAQKYVKETYNKKVTQDEADAICIGAYYVNKDIGFNWGD